MNEDIIVKGTHGVGKTDFLETFRLDLELDENYPDIYKGKFHLCDYLIDTSSENQTGFQEVFVNDNKKTFGWYVFEPLAFSSQLRRDAGKSNDLQAHTSKENNYYLGTIARYKTLNQLASMHTPVKNYNFELIGGKSNLSHVVRKQYEALDIPFDEEITFSEFQEKVHTFLVKKGVLDYVNQ